MADLWHLNLHEAGDVGQMNDIQSLWTNRRTNKAFTNGGYDWSPVPASSWQDDAACSGVDPELFSVDSPPSKARDEQMDKALAVCNGCSVRAACLESASEMDRYFTVRGGETPTMVAGGKIPKYAASVDLRSAKGAERKKVVPKTAFVKQKLCKKGHDDWITYSNGTRRCNTCKKEGYTAWNKARYSTSASASTPAT